MMRTRLSLVATLLAGCMPNDFGDTLSHAPVQLVDRPNGFGSNAGRVLLPLAPPLDNPKAGSRLLFAGTDTASLAVVDYDGDGKPHVRTLTSDEISMIGLEPGLAGIASMAWLTSPSSGMVVLGVPEHVVVPGEPVPLGRVAFVRMALDIDGKLSFSTSAVPVDGSGALGGHFGLAVAQGKVTQTATEEVIAVADNGVGVLVPGGPVLASTTCVGPFRTPPDLYRALAVADFLQDGQQEIALGLPVAGGVGRVVILQYGRRPETPTAPPELYCAKILQAPDTGIQAVSGFGASLSSVPDWDGDGLAELLVGAPPDRAYLFTSRGSLPTKTFTKGDTLSEFGQRVVLVDIDRDGVPEVGISALQANVGKTARAGQVYFYKLNGDGVTPVATLFDSNPVANKEFFGIGLADMEFNSSRVCGKGTTSRIPVVGADKGVFAFFRFAGGAPDPRCFAQ